MTTFTIKRQFICLGFMLVLSSQLLAQNGKTYLVTNANDSGLGSLRAAVDSTNTNPNQDTITFSNVINGDTINLLDQISILNSLIIIGNDTTNTILDAGDSSRIFAISADDVQLIGLRIQNGRADEGGGIFSSKRMGIDQCAILNCNSSNKGGGIHCLKSLKIEHSNISCNRSQEDGGGVYCEDSTTIIQCVISYNRTLNDEGGGIYSRQFARIDSSIISDNYAGSFGGGINSTRNCHISNSIIRRDSSVDEGGGIHGDSVLMKNCLVTENLCMNSDGGGIYTSGDPVVVWDSEISFNRSDIQGAGIYCRDTLKVYYSKFIGNESVSDDGGGAWASNIISENSAFVGNRAQEGGAVAVSSSISMKQSVVSGNRANVGGGFYGTTIKLLNTTVSGNVAAFDGGGIFSLEADLSNSIIARNTALNQPDALTTNNFTIANSLIGDTSNFIGIFFDQGGNLFNSDPLFVKDVPLDDSLGGDLRLQACSPAINAGINDSLMMSDTLDLFGNPRIADTTVDMGAYEFTDPAPTDAIFYAACPCPDTLVITDLNISGLYKAANVIELKGNATLNGDTEFRAREVIIDPIVTSPQGLRFDLLLQPCSTANN